MAHVNPERWSGLKWLIPISFLAAALAGLAFLLLSRGVEVRLSEERIEGAVAMRLPLERTILGVPYEVRAVDVSLASGDRIGIEAEIAASALGRTVRFTASGSGQPVYREGALYVSDVALDDIRSLEPEPVEPTRAADGSDRLRAEDLGSRLAAGFEPTTEAAREVGRDLLERLLEGRPIYRLKETDVRGQLLRATLRDVRASEGTLVLVLDPLSAIARVLSAVVIIGLALAGIYLFVRYGGLRVLAAMLE